jgi:hypothetical protein
VDHAAFAGKTDSRNHDPRTGTRGYQGSMGSKRRGTVARAKSHASDAYGGAAPISTRRSAPSLFLCWHCFPSVAHRSIGKLEKPRRGWARKRSRRRGPRWTDSTLVCHEKPRCPVFTLILPSPNFRYSVRASLPLLQEWFANRRVCLPSAVLATPCIVSPPTFPPSLPLLTGIQSSGACSSLH